jgi:hypothetical protein
MISGNFILIFLFIFRDPIHNNLLIKNNPYLIIINYFHYYINKLF